MPSSNQFTATGPFTWGFFTKSTGIAYGVNVQGTTAGVYGEAIANSTGLRSSQDKSRPGVWGVGDHYGVYGASKDLYAAGNPPVDSTPRLSPELRQAVSVEGSVGVAGASRRVPGLIGTSDIAEPMTAFLDGTNSLIAHPVGAMGLSVNSAGVMGANVSSNTPVPPQITSLLTAGGVQSNAGVLGWSMHGRGGVFASATPVDATPPFPPTNQGAAQVRLVPGPVAAHKAATSQAPVQPLPSLPRNGLAGDLIAVDVAPNQGGSATQLWFCIKPSFPGNEGAAATWAQIVFGATVLGSY